MLRDSRSPISAEKEKPRKGRRVPQRVETGERERERERERKSEAQREEGGKYGCGESGTVEAVCAAM